VFALLLQDFDLFSWNFTEADIETLTNKVAAVTLSLFCPLM